MDDPGRGQRMGNTNSECCCPGDIHRIRRARGRRRLAEFSSETWARVSTVATTSRPAIRSSRQLPRCVWPLRWVILRSWRTTSGRRCCIRSSLAGRARPASTPLTTCPTAKSRRWQRLIAHLAGSPVTWAPGAGLLIANLAHRYVEGTDWEYSEFSLYDLGQAVAHMTVQARAGPGAGALRPSVPGIRPWRGDRRVRRARTLGGHDHGGRWPRRSDNRSLARPGAGEYPTSPAPGRQRHLVACRLTGDGRRLTPR